MAGDDPVGWDDSDEGLDARLDRVGHDIGQSCRATPGCNAEVQIPDGLLQVTRTGGGADAGLVVGVGKLATEAFGPDPPAVSVGSDAGECLEVREHDVSQRDEVVVLAGAAIVPHAEERGEHGGDARLVDGREPSRFWIAGQERVDVAGEAVDPPGVAEPAVVVGQAEMAQVDHRVEPVAPARLERPIPQRPVVDAALGFGQPPGHAVAPHLHSEPSDLGEVRIEPFKMSACSVLVDADDPSFV